MNIHKYKLRKLLPLFFIYILISMVIGSLYMTNTTNLDEGTYLAVGMIIGNGGMVYTDIYENKPPLFHIFNAIIYYIFGSDVEIARFIVILLTAGTGIIIYLITKDFCGNKYATFSGLIFMVYSSLPIFSGLYVMTEPFSVFTGTMGIFLFLKYSSTKSKKYGLFSGIFLGSTILIRLTGIVLFGIVVLWIFVERYHKKLSIYRIYWIIAGAIIPFLAVMLFLIYHHAFEGFLGWILQPYIQGFIATATQQQKMTWFIDVLIVTLPLWVLLGIGLTKYNNSLLMLMALWPISLVLLFIFANVPGYHHYYYETLPGLSVLGAKGLENIMGSTREYLSKYGPKSFKFVTMLLLFLFIIVLFGLSIQKNISIYPKEYVSNEDMIIINKTVSYLDDASSQDKTFVFETKWPKIGPYIYYLSEKKPPNENLFFFPTNIPDERVLSVIDILDSEKIDHVVIIGPNPPFKNAKKIYVDILSKYKPAKKITDDFAPYSWLTNQSVWIYERIHENQSSISIQNFEDINKKTIMFSSPNNTIQTKYSMDYVKEGNYSLNIEYLFQSGQKNSWFTIFFSNDSIYWSNEYPVLSLWIYGDDSKNVFYIDITDKNKNTGRYSYDLDFKGWRQILVPISHEIFVQPQWSNSMVNFSQIDRISISVDGIYSRYGKIYIDDISLYFSNKSKGEKI